MKDAVVPSPLLIGQFSKLSGLSCRMLRFYAEQGILAPAFTNASSGYRRYLASQLTEAEKLRRLRRADFSPGEIAAILDGIGSVEWQKRVASQREVLRLKMRALEEALEELSLLEEDFAREECLLASFAPIRVRSALAEGRTSLRESARVEATRLFGEFDREAPIIRAYDLKKDTETSTLHIPVDDQTGETLAGCLAAATLHKGEREAVPVTLERVLDWVKSKGYSTNGRVHEWHFPCGEKDAPCVRVEIAVVLNGAIPAE